MVLRCIIALLVWSIRYNALWIVQHICIAQVALPLVNCQFVLSSIFNFIFIVELKRIKQV